MSQWRYSSQLIEHTKRVWQAYSVAPLSDQDAEEILRNVLDLTSYLSRLQADS